MKESKNMMPAYQYLEGLLQRKSISYHSLSVKTGVSIDMIEKMMSDLTRVPLRQLASMLDSIGAAQEEKAEFFYLLNEAVAPSTRSPKDTK